jgi:hypothetical protein
MVGIFPSVDLFFNRKITVDSVHYPWTTGTSVHGGLAMAGQRGLTGARWLIGGGTTGRGVHGESTSGLTGARAAVWRSVDGGEEMTEEALGLICGMKRGRGGNSQRMRCGAQGSGSMAG